MSWDWFKGKELELVVLVVKGLWDAQTKCTNLQSYRYSAIDSCRSLLAMRVPDGHLPDMPEERFPEGGDGTLTPKEAATVYAAARGLHRVDREVESLAPRTRQTLANHGDLLEEAVGSFLEPVNLTKPGKSAPPTAKPAKARGAALLRRR